MRASTVTREKVTAAVVVGLVVIGFGWLQSSFQKPEIISQTETERLDIRGPFVVDFDNDGFITKVSFSIDDFPRVPSSFPELCTSVTIDKKCIKSLQMLSRIKVLNLDDCKMESGTLGQARFVGLDELSILNTDIPDIEVIQFLSNNPVKTIRICVCRLESLLDAFSKSQTKRVVIIGPRIEIDEQPDRLRRINTGLILLFCEGVAAK